MLLRIIVCTLLASLFSSSADAWVVTQSGQQESEGTLTEKERTRYVEVKLTADLDQLSDNQRKMIGLLIEAGKQMDAVFWLQAYGDKDELLNRLSDPKLKQFAQINYGPWVDSRTTALSLMALAPNLLVRLFIRKDCRKRISKNT